MEKEKRMEEKCSEMNEAGVEQNGGGAKER